MRTSKRLVRRATSAALTPRTDDDPVRIEAKTRARADLETWRAQAIPDTSAPLDAEDVVRLLRECIAALDLDPAIATEFTVNTVHYYRRKDVIDPPDGRTAAARYGVRHLWQVAGARLAGFLGLVTLAEARSEMRSADTERLLDFLVARIADARARTAMRASGMMSVRSASLARPLPGVPRTSPASIVAEPALMISLPGNAWCIVPAAHRAVRSREAASELARALAAALRDNQTL